MTLQAAYLDTLSSANRVEASSHISLLENCCFHRHIRYNYLANWSLNNVLIKI